MPEANHEFNASAALGVPAGQVTYERVASIFEWFGFDRNRVPYTRLDNGDRVIDDQSLFQ